MAKKNFSEAVNLDMFFSEAEQQEDEVKQQEDPVAIPAKKGKTGKKTDTHKPFSFWAIKEDADNWRIWAKAKNIKVDDMGAEAMKEYILNHPLSENQQQLYDLMQAEKKL